MKTSPLQRKLTSSNLKEKIPESQDSGIFIIIYACARFLAMVMVTWAQRWAARASKVG